MMSLQDAERLARRLFLLEQKEREVLAVFREAIQRAQAELDAITAQQKAAVAPLIDEMDWARAELEVFQRERLEESGEKTIRLPHATLICRKQPQVFVRDDEALLAWAEDNAAEFVKVSRSVAWGDLKRQLDVVDGRAVFAPTGEVIEAITPEEEVVKFSVEVVE